MRYVFAITSLAIVAFSVLQYPSWQTAQQQLAIAEERVAKVIADGTYAVTFDDLPDLRRLPSNIGDVPNLIYLSLRNTKVSKLTGLQDNLSLQHLDLNHTRADDLTPLESLPKLRLIYLHGTWVKDVSPLLTLPSLERLDIGKTHIETLLPVTQMKSLNWLNLHQSHALDGSQDYYTELEGRPFLELSGGSAYRQNYVPGWQYNAMLRLSRLKEQLGF